MVDQQTDVIWLFLNWNRGDDEENQIISRTSKDTRRVYLSRSEDDGQNWSPPKEITSAIKPADWNWYGTGPGNGIQLRHGPHRGRLIIPCYHTKTSTKSVYYQPTSSSPMTTGRHGGWAGPVPKVATSRWQSS